MLLSPSSLQWLSLIGIIWLQSINGTNSDLPAYSSQLKKLLSISQIQLNNLAFASDAGKLLGCVSGIAAMHLPLCSVLLIGAVLGAVGYGVQYLFLVHKIASLPYWVIFLLTAVAGNSICWINTVCYIVTITNFPSHDRQIAVGLSTSYVGLSAKVYNTIVDVIFPSYTSPGSSKKAEAYLLLNSIVPLVVSVVAAPLVREIQYHEGSNQTTGGFGIMFVITVVTGIYAIICDLGPVVILPKVLALGLGLLLAAPLIVVFSKETTTSVKCFRGEWPGKSERVHDFTICERPSVEEMEVGKTNEEVEEVAEMMIREEIGPCTMLKRLDFWLYFFIYMFGVTIGLVFLNNLGQIAESRGMSNATKLVSLSSSFGFFGRLIPSVLDYIFSKSKFKMVSRPGSILIFMAVLTGFFMLLNITNLYLTTAVIGVCTGAITSISISTTTELFGAKNFSVNHNILVTNIPIGSGVFGYLAASLYERETPEGSSEKCMGSQCYGTTFFVLGSLCFLGTVLSLILYLRTRKFYSEQRITKEQVSAKERTSTPTSLSTHNDVCLIELGKTGH